MSETSTPFIFLIFAQRALLVSSESTVPFARRPPDCVHDASPVESGRIHRTVISLAGPATDRTPRMTDLLLTFMFRRAHIVQWWPILRVAMLICDERFGPRRQNMQRLQEFDDAVLQVGG